MNLRKQDFVIAIILILSISAVIYYYLNNKCISVKYSIEAQTFKSSINTIYEEAINYHAKNSSILTYERIFEVEIKSNNIVKIDVNSVVTKHKDLSVDCNGKKQKG